MVFLVATAFRYSWLLNSICFLYIGFQGHSEANPHSDYLKNDMFTTHAAMAINAALREVQENVQYQRILRMFELLDMQKIPEAKLATGQCMPRRVRDATSRFLNRIMMLPINAQQTMFDLIHQKLATMEDAGSGYKSLRGKI